MFLRLVKKLYNIIDILIRALRWESVGNITVSMRKLIIIRLL